MSHHHHDIMQHLEHGALPHNLGWREVLEAFRGVGAVEDHGHGKVALTFMGHRLVVHPGSEHEISSAELSELRHFLRNARAEPRQSESKAKAWVLTIDHHQARLYRFGSAQAGEHFEPNDPHGFHHHLIHRKEANYQGQRVPEDKAFYEAIVQAVRHAPALVVLSDGKGKGNAGHVFAEHVAEQHRDLLGLVDDVRDIDLSALHPAAIVAIASGQAPGRAAG